MASSRLRLLPVLAGVLMLAHLDAAPTGAASPCKATCESLGGGTPSWSPASVKACSRSCKQEQKKCLNTKGKKAGDCRDESKSCAEYCGQGWPVDDQAGDRLACQKVCGSCGRDNRKTKGGHPGRGFCVDPTDAGGVARCCGGPGEGPCCGSVLPRCCQPGETCCGARCIDTNRDPANCGGCGTACGPDQICRDGLCVTQVCADGPPCIDPISQAVACCAAGVRCYLGACVENICPGDVQPLPCGSSLAIIPGCCTPEDKCCPDATYGFNRCFSPQQVSGDSGVSVGSKDEIQCCYKNDPGGSVVAKGCPVGSTCCASEASFFSCCLPGTECDATSGLCNPVP